VGSVQVYSERLRMPTGASPLSHHRTHTLAPAFGTQRAMPQVVSSTSMPVMAPVFRQPVFSRASMPPTLETLETPGAHFPCFTRTKVHILTPEELRRDT
jgi:hypothetical protein